MKDCVRHIFSHTTDVGLFLFSVSLPESGSGSASGPGSALESASGSDLDLDVNLDLRRDLNLDMDLGLDARPEAKPAPMVAEVKPTTASPESFSIAAIIVGGWLWLEELPGAVLASEQVQLITAIGRALGLPQAQPAVAQFDWPIHTNQQFDLGPDAAASGLQGFVQRQLTDFDIKAVVLLGDECKTRLTAQQLNAERLLTTVSTRNMLERCELKRQAWQDLGPYASKL